jgi:hypothetical protein
METEGKNGGSTRAFASPSDRRVLLAGGLDGIFGGSKFLTNCGKISVQRVRFPMTSQADNVRASL